MPGYEVASRGHFFLLFVNLCHIAASREAQEGNRDYLIEAALKCEQGGCDGITVHLREDRRYIKDRDVFAIKDAIRGKLNIEIPLSNEIIKIAKKVKPYQVTMVPEKSEEMTAGGGFDIRQNEDRIRDAVKLFRDQDILVSLSVAPDIETIELSKECGADFIEIHTGKYCNATDKTEIDRELDRIYGAANHAVKLGLKICAGHGLTYKNIMPVLYARALEQVNIGHSIISRSLSIGLPKAVEEMLDILD